MARQPDQAGMVQIGERALAVKNNNIIINNCGCMHELALHQMRLSPRGNRRPLPRKAGARRWMVALKEDEERECRRAQECAGVC